MAGVFQTPQNERSFSSLIDDAIIATGKPGSLISAIDHANLTIRECQSLGLFAQDLLEEQFVTNAVPFIWTRSVYFRKIRTAYYPTIKTYPKFLLPGKQQRHEDNLFYAADNYYAFKGIVLGDTLNLANYYWQKPLIYFARLGQATTNYPGGPYNTRLAYFDTLLDKWQYLNATLDGYVDTTGDPIVDLSRQQNSSNWLVDQWRELLLSGIKAKIWTSTGDTRAGPEYSFYSQTQKTFRNTIGLEAENF